MRFVDIGQAKSRSLVTLTFRYTTDFWFISYSDGHVSGEALVRYEMTADDARLRAVIQLLNLAKNGQEAYVPLITPILAIKSGFTDVLGVSAGYDEGAPVRRGRLKGEMTGSELTLSWAQPPDKLPYKISRVYPTKEEIISTNQGPAYTPWPKPAEIEQPAPGQWQAVVRGADLEGENGVKRWSTYWFAARIATAP